MNYNPKLIKGRNHRDLESLHPKVAELTKIFIIYANNMVNTQGLEIKVISTLRTWQEQTELYAQGRTKQGMRVTNAPAGRSIHNWGCAFDVGVFRLSRYNPRDTEHIYTEIAPFGKELGLFWGGDFNSIRDLPHYQYTGRYSNNEFLRLANSGKSIDELLQ